MANPIFNPVRNEISTKIKENGVGDITGNITQKVMLDMVNVTEDVDTASIARDASLEASIGSANTEIASLKEKDASQDVEIAKKQNSADSVGKKTTEGGEIFNSAVSAVENAHAEGDGTKATGRAAHAQGKDTWAYAEFSDTTGEGTVANDYAQSTVGRFNRRSQRFSPDTPNPKGNLFVVGNGTSASDGDRSDAFKVQGDGTAYLIGVGGYDGKEDRPFGKDIATAINSKSDKAATDAKDAEQDEQIALKANKSQVDAKNNEQDAEIAKKLNTADAVGRKTAEGGEIFNDYYNNTATKGATHAEGYSTHADGDSSHAEGNTTIAKGGASHSEGLNTKALGNQAHSEGRNTTAFGNASHSEGQSLRAVPNETIIKDNDGIIADWTDSKFSLAKGSVSHTEGQDCLALGLYSHAEGLSTLASGEQAHAEGAKTKATGQYSAHAEGEKTEAIGDFTHAEGFSTKAKGRLSHTEGYFTETNNESEHAQGKFNKSNKGTIDSVGIGTSEGSRKNATETMRDGKHYILNIGGYDGNNVDTAKDLATEFYGGGALTRLLTKCGMSHDGGIFGLNGIELSLEEAMTSFIETNTFLRYPLDIGSYYQAKMRTNIVYANSYALSKPQSLERCFRECNNLEKLVLTNFESADFYLIAISLKEAFYYDKKLEAIIGVINVKNCSSFADAFNNCLKLREIRIFNLNKNISLKESSNFSDASLLYMINNEAASGSITITLESSAYDRLNASQNVKNALAAHPNIKLAK